MKGLNPSKAAGNVNLSRKFLKDGADILARPILQLCNHCIKLNSFPRSCKIVKIKPLFKKGSKTDPQNYRPISLLPISSKTIERVIHDKTKELWSKSKILYRSQHLSRTSNWWNYYRIWSLFTGMILIDLQKVFDTVNLQILIKKMKYLGFSKNVIAWFKSYFSERKFKIKSTPVTPAHRI